MPGDLSNPGIEPPVTCIGRRIFATEPPGKPDWTFTNHLLVKFKGHTIADCCCRLLVEGKNDMLIPATITVPFIEL